MKKWILLVVLGIFLVGCSSNDEGQEHDEHNHDEHHDEDVAGLEVDFQLPEQASVGEVVELKAIVTSNGEPITDAEEMDFEYWNVEDDANTTHIIGEHTENGEYKAEVTFTEPGTYEIYAHTTANGLHTMPKKAIEITD